MSKIIKFDNYRNDEYNSQNINVIPVKREENNRNRRSQNQYRNTRQQENRYRNEYSYSNRTPKRKRRRRKIYWGRIFLLILLILIFAIAIYIYSKRNAIVNWINTTKEQIEIAMKPDEYWDALNDVYVTNDILMSIPMGTYYDSEQQNTCAVKVPRKAKIAAECRYRDKKDYMFSIANGTQTAESAIEGEILNHGLAIRTMEIVCENSNTKMKYTVYSLEDGKYSTICTLNPNAVQVGTEEHPAVAYYTNSSFANDDMYMYYYINEETTLHISYSGPLAEVLDAEELGQCILNMIDEYIAPEETVENETNINEQQSENDEEMLDSENKNQEINNQDNNDEEIVSDEGANNLDTNMENGANNTD